MNDKTKVIVLSQTLYKEQDALVKVFSIDHGLMTFIAKGTQKMQSKNRAFIQPYNIYEYHFDLKPNTQLCLLKYGELIQSNHKIQADLLRSSIASLLVELTEFILHNETKSQVLDAYFNYLSKQLKRANEEQQLYAVLVFALVHFAQQYGIEPQLDACVLCDDTQINSFSVEEGGFICTSCQKQVHSSIYTPDFLRQLRVSNRVNDTHFERYRDEFEPSAELIKLWFRFVEYHSGVQLKSWEFMRKWSIIV